MPYAQDSLDVPSSPHLPRIFNVSSLSIIPKERNIPAYILNGTPDAADATFSNYADDFPFDTPCSYIFFANNVSE
jgi:hypothetical protein